MYVENLTGTIYKNGEQLGLYGAQCDAQIQETKAIKEAVSEASLELEVICHALLFSVPLKGVFIQVVLLEKKKLIQQWNNTLIGMRRRDEAYAAMMSAVR